jgi:transcriptional regulator with XRE-family HTH domain
MVRKTTKTTNINNIIGNRIYKLRLSCGLSRSKLAKELDITHQQIFKYEEGSNTISASKLYLISKILNTPINFFYENIDENENLDEFSKQHQTLCLHLSTNFMLIKNSKVQKSIADLVKSFANENV